MKSGVFNDLISGMNDGIQDGSLDLGKLMGTVQKMCSSLGVDKFSTPPTDNSGTPQAPNPMDMISSLMGSINSHICSIDYGYLEQRNC